MARQARIGRFLRGTASGGAAAGTGVIEVGTGGAALGTGVIEAGAGGTGLGTGIISTGLGIGVVETAPCPVWPVAPSAPTPVEPAPIAPTPVEPAPIEPIDPPVDKGVMEVPVESGKSTIDPNIRRLVPPEELDPRIYRNPL